MGDFDPKAGYVIPSRGFEYQGLIGKTTWYRQMSRNLDGGWLPGTRHVATTAATATAMVVAVIGVTFIGVAFRPSFAGSVFIPGGEYSGSVFAAGPSPVAVALAPPVHPSHVAVFAVERRSVAALVMFLNDVAFLNFVGRVGGRRGAGATRVRSVNSPDSL